MKLRINVTLSLTFQTARNCERKCQKKALLKILLLTKDQIKVRKMKVSLAPALTPQPNCLT
jgi:hypothetical protein